MAVKPLPVHGADISHHQASVDLARAQKAGLDWVFHKCTQGKSFVDAKYASRRDASRKIHLPFGAYHFATTSDPVQQANHFLKVAGIKPGDLRPMLDLENSPGSNFAAMSTAARTAWVKKFVDVIFKALGVKPFIYTPFDLNDHFDCPLWVARYSNSNAAPHVPRPWNTYTVRQFSNGQFGVPNSFPGLGHVDLNCFHGRPKVLLAKFTIPHPVKPAVPKPAAPKPAVPAKPVPAPIKASPTRGMKAPRKSLAQWGGFVHLLARFYMNYVASVMKAAGRKKNRSADVDGQESADHTMWALHWATLGKNKLHDPSHKHGPNTRIDHLHDTELARMRGPKNQTPQKMVTVLELAADHRVRIEVELKSDVSETALRKLMNRPKIKAMDDRGDLQYKTLAQLDKPNGAAQRLAVAHKVGGTTILSFTSYSGPGISKKGAWPVTDFVRGKAKWIA